VITFWTEKFISRPQATSHESKGKILGSELGVFRMSLPESITLNARRATSISTTHPLQVQEGHRDNWMFLPGRFLLWIQTTRCLIYLTRKGRQKVKRFLKISSGNVTFLHSWMIMPSVLLFLRCQGAVNHNASRRSNWASEVPP
jgi:hypothetical protein